MPPIQRVTLGHDNYPKAVSVSPRSVNRVKQKPVQTSPVPRPSDPVDSVTIGGHDSDADQIARLRRQAQIKRPSVDSPSPYPKAPSPHKEPGGQTETRPSTQETKAPVQQEAASSHSQTITKPGPSIDEAPAYPTVKSTKAAPDPEVVQFMVKHQKRVNSQPSAQKPVAANPKRSVKPQPSTPKAKPQVKPRSKPNQGNMKSKLNGGLSVGSGLVTVGNGLHNLANGNYTEGSLQVGQGSLSIAGGANDLKNAKNGFSKAPTQTLKRANSIVSGGMAVYDGVQAYQAYKSGNSVQAAEEASSAIINAVTACPVTAPIGAVGGILDYAMAVSGADDAMVRGLSAASTRAYNKQTAKDMKLAQTLVLTPTARLRQCNQKEKAYYIRGIEGLKQYRALALAEGKQGAVEDIDAHIARVKGAWTIHR